MENEEHTGIAHGLDHRLLLFSLVPHLEFLFFIWFYSLLAMFLLEKKWETKRKKRTGIKKKEYECDGNKDHEIINLKIKINVIQK